MSINRRSSQRHNVVVPAKLAIDGETYEVMIDNLSLGGAQLVLNRRLSMGQRVKLLFQVPGREDTLELGAMVRWSSAESAGLQFEGLRARDVWALSKFFEALD